MTAATPHHVSRADEAATWLRAQGARQLHADSRRVGAGDAFLAWTGARHDARRFVPDALRQGAVACLVEAEGVEAFDFDDARVAACAQLKAVTGAVAAAFYEHPSRQLATLAVTGTNGKTSTAWWLAHALAALPPPWTRPCAIVGTLGVGVPGQLEDTGMTSPDPVLLQRRLRDFVAQGLTACAMEASSIGLTEGRLEGLQIDVAVFTNLTQDHLDYHGDMARYGAAKDRLFRWPGLRAAVVNIDDPHGATLARSLQGAAMDLWTVSARGDARLQARNIRAQAQGLHFDVIEEGQSLSMATHLVGDYNVSNLLGVMAALRALGVPLAEVVRVCADLAPVPGRMERVTLAESDPALPVVVVDYAHTPDALDKALSALRPMAQARAGQLWCVFGCGGDRDAAKRPLMGRMAEAVADAVVLTSDNPRSEPPEQIAQQVLQGFRSPQRVHAEPDRAAALAWAIARAAANDVVLVAGKGHEAWQEVQGVKRPFSDVAESLACLRRRAAQGRGVQ